MDEGQLNELARGLIPFVREVVEPFEKRLAEVEARPIVKGDPGEQGPPGPKGDSGELALLPPELAEQIASAVRMLHESPAISAKEAPPSPKVTRIERDADGNFVPVYDQPV